jgi:hypothetical protein
MRWKTLPILLIAMADLCQAGVSLTTIIYQVADPNFQEPDQKVHWNNVALPKSWVRADDYIEIRTDFTPDIQGGIRLYTDNTAGDAAPFNFSGTPSTGYLVDTTSHKKGIPVGWLIRNFLAAPDPFNPDLGWWFYSLDKAQSTFNSNVNYESPIRIGGGSIFYQENVDSLVESGKDSLLNAYVFYLFLEANFATAVTPNTYGTKTLRLEAYSQ